MLNQLGPKITHIINIYAHAKNILVRTRWATRSSHCGTVLYDWWTEDFGVLRIQYMESYCKCVLLSKAPEFTWLEKKNAFLQKHSKLSQHAPNQTHQTLGDKYHFVLKTLRTPSIIFALRPTRTIDILFFINFSLLQIN